MPTWRGPGWLTFDRSTLADRVGTSAAFPKLLACVIERHVLADEAAFTDDTQARQVLEVSEISFLATAARASTLFQRPPVIPSRLKA